MYIKLAEILIKLIVKDINIIENFSLLQLIL
jgi:hypothetical protein